MSSVFNKIANAVTGHSDSTTTSNSSDANNASNPSNASNFNNSNLSRNDASSIPAGNQYSGVGPGYAGTNYTTTDNGALKEGSQVRDTGLGSGSRSKFGSNYSNTADNDLASGSSTDTTPSSYSSSSTTSANPISSSRSSRTDSTGYGTGTGIGTGTDTDFGTGTGTGIGTTGTTSTTGTAYDESGDRPSDDAMTRSEEHLLVGKEKVNIGKAELNKYVTTERVSTAVPIVREKVIVDREPITETNREAAMRGPDFKESHYEVNLMEERAVAEKQTVPMERVRLRKEAVQSQQYVEADLRKEHIELVDPTKGGGLESGSEMASDSSDLTTGTGSRFGSGTKSDYSKSNLSSDRQIAADDTTSSSSLRE